MTGTTVREGLRHERTLREASAVEVCLSVSVPIFRRRTWGRRSQQVPAL